MELTSKESLRILAATFLPIGVCTVGGILIGWRWMISAAAELEKSGEYVCGLIAIPYVGGGFVVGAAVGLVVAVLALWKTGQL